MKTEKEDFSFLKKERKSPRSFLLLATVTFGKSRNPSSYFTFSSNFLLLTISPRLSVKTLPQPHSGVEKIDESSKVSVGWN